MAKIPYAPEYNLAAYAQSNQYANTIDILGVRVSTLRLEDMITAIVHAVASRQRMAISYANIHALNLAYDQPWFRDCLNHSDIVFCDGFGVKWGAELLGAHIPERFTLPDYITQLAIIACQHNFSLFFLGARPGIAQQAAEQLQTRFPDLNIKGTYHGYFDKTLGSTETEAAIQMINAAKPDILLIGFGMPIQERWLFENRDRLDTTVALCAGAAFDYIADAIPRAPAWMTDHGLEWLGRLVLEPRRLWRRYVIGNPLFLYRVLRQRRIAIRQRPM